MIIPENIFASNETCFSGDVKEAELVQFLKDWLLQKVPPEIGQMPCFSLHGPDRSPVGLKVIEVKVTKQLEPDAFRVIIRHEINPNSPVINANRYKLPTPQMPPLIPQGAKLITPATPPDCSPSKEAPTPPPGFTPVPQPNGG